MKELNLIRKIAWSFHRTTAIDFEELFSEGCLAYAETLPKYTPDKGKLTTFIHLVIHSHLKNYIAKIKKNKMEFVSIDSITYLEDSHQNSLSILDHLSKEAQIITEIVLNEPCKYSLMTPQQAIKNIGEKMVKINGFSMKHVWVGIQDLKTVFS